MTLTKRVPLAILVWGCCTVASLRATAAELQLDARLWSSGTSNVFGDKSQEPDVSGRLGLEGRVDFAQYWSAGYEGWLAAFVRHPELFSHYHEAFLFLNPQWGQEEDKENELVVEARVETLRNGDRYRSLNVVPDKVQEQNRTRTRAKTATRGSHRAGSESRTAAQKGAAQGSGSGAGFVDANGDGVCDKYQSKSGSGSGAQGGKGR